MSPAKHSYVCLPRKCDYRTDTHTDRQTQDKVIPMCRYASQSIQKCTLNGWYEKHDLHLNIITHALNSFFFFENVHLMRTY